MSSSSERGSPGARSLRAVFGFDLDEAGWLERLRHSQGQPEGGLGRIGEYELVGAVGRGGQGVVYRARQPRTGREIALKRLSAGVFATPEMHARFAREIEAAAALDHPNIVTVYGSETIDGQPVLAMQWIDGVPFDHWASGHADDNGTLRRDIRQVLDVFAVICDAIHHAHQRGIIHRDIKPSNILIDRKDRPHVLDFGLAKLNYDSRADVTLTHTGAFVGTPAYAAPELVLGRHRDVDVRTDIYALGAVLYQALTGTMAFATSLELPRLLHDIQQREPRAPSTLNPRLDGEIDAIVLKSLAKEKDQRYASVEGLAADVRRYLAGQTVLAHPPSTAYRARKFVRQHKGMVAVAAAFVTTLLAATISSTSLYLSADRERRRADKALLAESEQLAKARQEEERAKREASRADEESQTHVAITDFMRSVILSADPGNTEGRADITMKEVLDRVSHRLTTPTNVYRPRVKAALHMAMGDLFLGRSEFADAESHFLAALDLRRQHLEPDHDDILSTLHFLGRAYRQQGRYQDALDIHREVVDIRRRRTANEPPTGKLYLAQALASLAITLRTLNRPDEALAATYEAFEIYRASLGEEDENVANQMRQMAILLMPRGLAAEAECYARSALHVYRQMHNDRPHNDIGRSLFTFGTAQWAVGDKLQGETTIRQALYMFLGLYGELHEQTAAIQQALGAALSAQGRPAEAYGLFASAYNARLALFGEDHPLTAESRASLEQMQTQIPRK